jgi:hypothetical protein
VTSTFLAANSTSTINDVEPGLLGFLVVAGLALALVFLLRSMNKQFKKIGPKPSEKTPSATRRYSVQARRMASGSPHQPSDVRRSSSSIAPSTDHIAVTCRKSPSILSSSKSSS